MNFQDHVSVGVAQLQAGRQISENIISTVNNVVDSIIKPPEFLPFFFEPRLYLEGNQMVKSKYIDSGAKMAINISDPFDDSIEFRSGHPEILFFEKKKGEETATMFHADKRIGNVILGYSSCAAVKERQLSQLVREYSKSQQRNKEKFLKNGWNWEDRPRDMKFYDDPKMDPGFASFLTNCESGYSYEKITGVKTKNGLPCDFQRLANIVKFFVSRVLAEKKYIGCSFSDMISYTKKDLESPRVFEKGFVVS
jgi:hypothetical protein